MMKVNFMFYDKHLGIDFAFLPKRKRIWFFINILGISFEIAWIFREFNFELMFNWILFKKSKRI